jgi:hypothetical protein
MLLYGLISDCFPMVPMDPNTIPPVGSPIMPDLLSLIEISSWRVGWEASRQIWRKYEEMM